ncbi:hypothetical protein BHM03_00049338 [Ensete ventricosum]|nr:hypothetical protein BHM03_00049338 [Ensete ventricosum]
MKALCWHCDEPWSHDHRCKKGCLLLIEPIEEPKLEDAALKPEKDTEEKLQPAARIFHASSGFPNSQIMNVDGLIKLQRVTILIDTRSPNDLMNGKGKQVTLHGIYDWMKIQILKEQEEGIYTSTIYRALTTMMPSISVLALPDRSEVFEIGEDISWSTPNQH